MSYFTPTLTTGALVVILAPSFRREIGTVEGTCPDGKINVRFASPLFPFVFDECGLVYHDTVPFWAHELKAVAK